MSLKIQMVFGTRPEAIKMAPLARLLRNWPGVELFVCSTGQHREMLRQVLEAFELEVDEDLDLMTQGQTLNGLSQQLLLHLDESYARVRPDMVLVHGDTTTSFIAALAAFHRQIAIGHVEAGLRTGDLRSPWPEEANRSLTGVLADLHFAPTADARDNLLREGRSPESIEVTGNTVIDALLWMRDHQRASQWQPTADSPLAALDPDKRLVLITGHRRENFGKGFEQICQALAELAGRYPQVQFVYPVHLNPQVRGPVHALLDGLSNIHLVAPQDYPNFVWLMDRAHLILTDSGGVQEEAPALGKPVLVLREVTERPAVLEGGTVLLVGTDPERIVAQTARLLDDAEAYRAMNRVFTPFGDGHASEKIAQRLTRWAQTRTSGSTQ